MSQSNETTGSSAAFALARPAIRFAPSLLAADFSHLAEAITCIEEGGADLLHLDVMDGHFVPNISFGPAVIADIRKKSKLFFDTHLMIADPVRYTEAFAKAGSDLITFHIEVTENPQEAIDEIRKWGKAVGVSINPGTEVSAIESILPQVDLVLVMSVWPGFGGQKFMPEVLSKVRQLRELLRDDQRLEIDGGIGPDTITQIVQAGADTLVAGTAILGQPDRVAAMNSLRKTAEEAAKEVTP